MAGLTDKEKEVLLEAVRKIHVYKLMQAKGYKKLSKKSTDKRTRQLLTEISTDELNDAESWSRRIK